MGTKHSQQRCVQDSEQAAARDTIGIKESQYGSWTKLSLVLSDSCTTQEQAGNDNGTFHGGDVGVTSCSQFLTQPPSEQQDSIIREVAEKLLDVEADVSKPEHPTSFPPPSNAARATEDGPLTPKPARHYSLQLRSLVCPSEEGAQKDAIAGSLLEHFETLVEQINPEEVANKLYGIAVLDSSEVEMVMDEDEPKEDRTRRLIQLVKTKLWQNPGWFADVCKILRACGVKAISQVIDDVQKKSPSEDVSNLSPGFTASIGSKKSLPRRQTSHQDTFIKLEESFKASGFQGATEYVGQLSTEQPALVLVHEACLGGVDVSTLDLLLNILAEKNHDINSKSECGQTPLHIACGSLRSPAEPDALESNVEQRLKIEHLLSNKASNWIKDKDGNTPLHLAVLRADSESVSTLLSYGKRCLNVVNKRGNTALHLACKHELVDIVKTLCGYNADTSIQNKKMKTALHIACIQGHNDAALELASHDPSTLDGFDKHHMTPLHIACKKGNEMLAISLLKLRNCVPNKTDEDNKTPLHYACGYGSTALVSAVLKKDSSKVFVDKQDRYGDTALHIASGQGHREVVKELLSQKANKDVLNQERKTAVDLAIESDHNSIATKMLRKRGWNQRRKSLSRVRKLRRTLTQASLVSTNYQSEMSEILENSSDESDDETTGMGTLHITNRSQAGGIH